MTPETLAVIDRMKPAPYVWCQFSNTPGSKNDEHQVCIDRQAAHYARGFSTWGCTCKCHK
jgi:hypothetical protein